ncbi:MAG: hypothetical protein R2873_16315 [Caldilineaceae bacterium]
MIDQSTPSEDHESEDHEETLQTLHFDIFTLFPGMFTGPFGESILKRAQEKGLLSIALHDIRAYTTDRHHVCDDTPLRRRRWHDHEAGADLPCCGNGP